MSEGDTYGGSGKLQIGEHTFHDLASIQSTWYKKEQGEEGEPQAIAATPSSTYVDQVNAIIVNQDQSMFWSNLPLKLRLKVYEAALGGYLICSKAADTVGKADNGLVAKQMWSLRNHETVFFRNSNKDLYHQRSDISSLDTLIRTCKVAYIEGRSLLYAANSYSFTVALDIRSCFPDQPILQILSPPAFNPISYVRRLQVYFRNDTFHLISKLAREAHNLQDLSLGFAKTLGSLKVKSLKNRRTIFGLTLGFIDVMLSQVLGLKALSKFEIFFQLNDNDDATAGTAPGPPMPISATLTNALAEVVCLPGGIEEYKDLYPGRVRAINDCPQIWRTLVEPEPHRWIERRVERALAAKGFPMDDRSLWPKDPE